MTNDKAQMTKGGLEVGPLCHLSFVIWALSFFTMIDTYEQAIEYLYSRINYERFAGNAWSASDFRLDRMREFLRRLGDPQESIPAVHIAGTKGKGSTAVMTAAVLTAAGYRTGLFTSPHITDFEERFVVDGQQASRAEVVELVNEIIGIVGDLDATPGQWGPTYFEIATALAWLLFRRRKVDIAVLEVGLGGRLDATNVCRPLVTVITSISRDHTRQLGSRIEQIAWEKAGIVKPGVPLVSGVTNSPARETIADVCRDVGAPRLQMGEDLGYHIDPEDRVRVSVRVGDQWTEGLRSPLLGEHQAHNLALCVAAVSVLRQAGLTIPDDAISRGLETVRWPGRVEVVRRDPTVIVDAAHNWASVTALLRTVRTLPARQRLLVFAATRDKDVAGMLRQLLPEFDTVILTSYVNNPRGLPVPELRRLTLLAKGGSIHAAPDAATALKLALRLADPEDLICITGSFFIAAELRELLTETADVATSHMTPEGSKPLAGG